MTPLPMRAGQGGHASASRCGRLYVIGYVGDVVGRVLRRDTPVTSTSVRLTHIMAPMDHGKAGRELGWQPGPIHDSIRRAAQFYRENRRSSR